MFTSQQAFGLLIKQLVTKVDCKFFVEKYTQKITTYLFFC